MRLEQLKCLVDVAETGSISGTAQRLYVTQQAVSKSIRQLEQELGVELLVRTNTGVQLTSMGQKALAFAQSVLAGEQTLREEIQENRAAKETKPYQLNICSTSSVTNLALPSIISKLNNHQANVQINMVPMTNFDAVLEQVSSGARDLGLMTINEQELYRKISKIEDKLKVEVLVRDEMVMVMGRRYYQGNISAVNTDFLNKVSARTLYNIIPVDDIQQEVLRANIICSNDADFHRSMMEKAGAMTIMSGLAYQYYFNSRRYVALNFEEKMPTLIHAAIYRKDAGTDFHRFVSMIRKEMCMK